MQLSLKELVLKTLFICWIALGASSATYAEAPLDSGNNEDADANSRLDAIKEKLIEAAFGAGMRVRSVAYLDQSGKLKQDAFFSSEVQVRGHQVLSYVNEFDKNLTIGEAKLPVDKICDAWELHSKNGRGVVKLRSTFKPATLVSENAIPEDKRQELIEMFDRVLTDHGFNVVHSLDPGASSQVQDTTYSANLVSNWAEGPPADFEVSLDLDLVNKSTNVFPSIYSSHAILYGPEVLLSNIGSRDYALELSATFSQPASQRILGETSLEAVFVAQRRYSSGAWTLGKRDQAIDEWTREAIESFTNEARCVPRVFEVEPQTDEVFAISAGLAHGINAGDWIVVANKNLMVGNIVSDATFESLSIMKVLSASEYSALAEPLAASNKFSDSMRLNLTGMLL